MKIVIIGGGFGGMAAVRALKDAPVEITLIDKRNFHLFQPLLYQVATGGLSPANIAAPLRGIVRKQQNVQVVMGEVSGFDLDNKRVLLGDSAVDYDVLIVATGSQYNYFGHPEWGKLAPSLKTLEDAIEIRSRIFHAFEQAELSETEEEARRWLTFVVIGGGPTGVEMAGAIAELARTTLPGDFRRIHAADARILLVEAAPRILPPYPESLSRQAHTSLVQLGAEVRANRTVTLIDNEGVTMRTPTGEEHIAARTVIWAAGVMGTTIGSLLAEAAGQASAPSGRIAVTPKLTLPGREDVFVIGDLAFLEQKGKPLPAVAPVAMQQGAYAAKKIVARLKGNQKQRDFRYKDRGSMATIGRSSAVADLNLIKLHGFPGWITWLVVHLMMIVRFENRVLVLVQWAWNYFTRGRSARLITGRSQETHRQGTHQQGAPEVDA